MVIIPSGKRLHSYGKIHHFSWENPLFQWSFSIAMLNNQMVIQTAGVFFGEDHLHFEDQ